MWPRATRCQFIGSPRTAWTQPRDVLRLALQSDAGHGGDADQGAHELDLAGVGHAVRDAGLPERADGGHVAERLHGDDRIQRRRVRLRDEVVGAGPDLLRVLPEQRDVLQAQGLGVRRRHARALSHRRQAELLRVPAFRPHGRAAILQHESHDVVLSPRVVPEDPRERVRLGVIRGHRMELGGSQVGDRLVQHSVQALQLGVDELEGGHHALSSGGWPGRRGASPLVLRLAVRVIFPPERPMGDWFPKQTLGSLPERAARRWGAREALYFKGRRWSFAELSEGVDRLARGLIALGVRPGEKVALWMVNRPEFIEAMFAVMKIGAVLVPINTRLRTEDTAYILGQSDSAVLLIADRSGPVDYLGMAKELAPSLRAGAVREERFKHLRLVVSAGDGPRAETVHWPAAQAAGEAVTEAALRSRADQVDPDATAFFVYTSGTTGFPKGAMHDHAIVRNLV